MKINNCTLTRIPADSYQVVTNDDNSIDLLFSGKLISELNINTSSQMQIKNDHTNNQSVIVIICEK